MAAIPATMRALVAPKFCKPDEYIVAEDIPVPSIKGPNELLLKVHAAGLMTGDTYVAAGNMKLVLGQLKYPIQLGIECSGVVVATGSAVTAFKPGDEVYGMAFGRPHTYNPPPGFCAEYCVAQESLLLAKPAGVSFEEAAGLIAFALTAYQSLELGLKHLKERGRTLEGATAFVPAALSATGALGVQLLKNVYGVSKVIATVSTPKVPLVERYLPGLVDQVIDYKTTKKLTDVVKPGSVDFAYNTQFSGLPGIVPLMKSDTGVIVSIASLFPKELFRKAVGDHVFPFWLGWLVDLAQLYYKWLLLGTNAKLDFVSGNAGARDDLEKTGELIALGKVKAVMRVVNLDDIATVRKACMDVFTGKGGLGKLVIKIV